MTRATRLTVGELRAENARLREALEDISASVGRCDRYVGPDGDDEQQCGRPAVFFEKDHAAFGLFNVCCDLPEHAEAHRYEIEKAKSKGSYRGTQAPIVLSREVRLAREALAPTAPTREGGTT